MSMSTRQYSYISRRMVHATPTAAKSEEVLAARGILLEADINTFLLTECGLRSVITREHAERLVRRHTGMGIDEWRAA